MRALIAVAILLQSLALAAADPLAEAGMRAMERLRAQWQLIADAGSLVVLRCEGQGEGEGFHAMRLKPQAKIEIESRSEPGSPFAASVHITSEVESNRNSRRANAIAVPDPRALQFICFETPEAARNAVRIDDFPARKQGRVWVAVRQSFSGTYWLENGALVLDSGSVRNLIQKHFDPAWQTPDSPWLKVFRFPIEG